MELKADPPPVREAKNDPLALLKLMVAKVEAGELRLRDMNINSYRDIDESERPSFASYTNRVLRGDQYFTVGFVLEPGSGVNADDDAESSPDVPTPRTGARDLIFD